MSALLPDFTVSDIPLRVCARMAVIAVFTALNFKHDEAPTDQESRSEACPPPSTSTSHDFFLRRF